MRVKRKLFILGAGGHGKVALDVAQSLALFSEIYFLDDNYARGSVCVGVRILGPLNVWANLIGNDSQFFIALGAGERRRNLFGELSAGGAQFCSLVSPGAIVSGAASIGSGSIVMPGAIVNSCAVIGSNTIINSGAIVEHDCIVGDHSHVAPGSVLTGGVRIGQEVLFGAGAIASPGIQVTDRITIAAGAVVVSDLREAGVYAGVPARRLNQ